MLLFPDDTKPETPREPPRETKEERVIRETESLLQNTLKLAVPLWIQKFRDSKWTMDDVIRQAHDCGRTLSEKGDVLMYGGKGCAIAFNALACGLAAGSFAPCGIRAFGLHFESDPAWLKV